jgi:hypothetical protein
VELFKKKASNFTGSFKVFVVKKELLLMFQLLKLLIVRVLVGTTV